MSHTHERELEFLGGPGITLLNSGGVDLINPPKFRIIVGDHMVTMKLLFEKGFVHPRHNHPEHESIGVILKGRIEMVIGDETFILGPGDTWHHPVGVYHSVLALEDVEAIETHSPRREDLVRIAAEADAAAAAEKENSPS